MGYVWLFFGVFAGWAILSTVLRALVVTSEPPEQNEILSIVFHTLIAAVCITVVVFVIRGGA